MRDLFQRLSSPVTHREMDFEDTADEDMRSLQSLYVCMPSPDVSYVLLKDESPWYSYIFQLKLFKMKLGQEGTQVGLYFDCVPGKPQPH